jgi:hypothetical protein
LFYAYNGTAAKKVILLLGKIKKLLSKKNFFAAHFTNSQNEIVRDKWGIFLTKEHFLLDLFHPFIYYEMKFFPFNTNE